MKTLRNLVNAKDQVHHSSDYINEDTAQQNAYNNAIDNGEDIISGQQNPIMNKTTIDQAINQINNAKMLYMVLINYNKLKMKLIKLSIN